MASRPFLIFTAAIDVIIVNSNPAGGGRPECRSLLFFTEKKCVEAKLASAASIEVREERKEELEDLQQQMDELEEEIKEESQARADERFKEIELPTGLEVVEEIKEWLERWGHSHWRNSIDSVAENLIPEEQRAASADRAPDAPRA